ncbi:MAG: PASTA domain-containing protein [bacterium]
MKHTHSRFFLFLYQFLLLITLYGLSTYIVADTPEKPAITLPAPNTLDELNSQPILQDAPLEELPAIDLSTTTEKENALEINTKTPLTASDKAPTEALEELPAIHLERVDNSASQAIETTEKQVPEPEEYLSHVPNLIGLTQEQAKTLLPDALLALGTITEVSDNATAGTIIAQSERPDTDVKPNTVVHLTVSTGPKQTIVETAAPDNNSESTLLANEEKSQAYNEQPNDKNTENETEIETETITTETTKEVKEAKENKTRQTQEYLSLVPNLIGLTVGEAKKKLPDYELTLGNITKLNDKKTPAGYIIAQSERADSHIKQGSTIDLMVSSSEQKESHTDNKESAEEDTSTQASDNNQEKAEQHVSKQASKSSPSPLSNVPLSNVTMSQEKADIEISTNTSSRSKVQVDAPKGLQTTRTIHFTVIPPSTLTGEKLEYNLSLAGKVYKQSSPTFTTQFSETGSIIFTGSVRVPGQSWHHSASKQITIKAYEAIKINVPNVVGLDEKAAKKALEKAGLQLGNIQKTVKGEQIGIVEQRPKAGTTLTEDNNTVHLVKAIGKKYKVTLRSSHKNIETDQAVTLTANVSPTPQPSDINYRFIINDKTHYSKTPDWQYTPKEAGTKQIKVEAHVKNEGAFHSDTLKIAVKSTWLSPKAVITPAKLTVTQGDIAKFDSSASISSDKNVTITWTDPNKKQHKGKTFSLDTKMLKAGSYPITLLISDKRDMSDSVKAILLIEEAKPQLIAKQDEKDEKRQEAAEKNGDSPTTEKIAQAKEDVDHPKDQTTENSTEMMSPQTIADTEKQPSQTGIKQDDPQQTAEQIKIEANKAASTQQPSSADLPPNKAEDALKQTLAAEATQTVLEDTASAIPSTQIPVSPDATEPTLAVINTDDPQKALEQAAVETLAQTQTTEPAENEALASATEPNEPQILEVDVPDSDVDIKPSTQKASIIETNTNTNTKASTITENRDWTLWLWLGILAVLFIAILWFLHKLR